jgi:hypothetical protein
MLAWEAAFSSQFSVKVEDSVCYGIS